ncbi:MAG: hypothetical protein PVJ86_11500 [Phycisphaerales bacterium]|jgi:hypothetical protein
MHRIDSPNREQDKFGAGKDGFTEGVPGVTPATEVTDDWLDGVQEELCNLIEGNGGTLSKGTRTQVRDILRNMVGTGAGPGLKGTGGSAGGTGVHGVGGSTDGVGVTGDGAGAGQGVYGTGGDDDGIGVYGQGGDDDGIGVYGVGGTTSGRGVEGLGTGGSTGVWGTGGPSDGTGVFGMGDGNGTGVYGLGFGTGNGVTGTVGGTGNGVKGTGGSSSGYGGHFIGVGDHGAYIEADTSSPAKSALHIEPQDAAPTGPNAIGDIYVTTAGVPYICTAAGTPGTWTKISAT